MDVVDRADSAKSEPYYEAPAKGAFFVRPCIPSRCLHRKIPRIWEVRGICTGFSAVKLGSIYPSLPK
jgi:hypothetical protein